ncbi:cation:proton antiporter [Spirochaeta africana]|nr:cation:proton antiporter [Spirochaeta africana]
MTHRMTYLVIGLAVILFAAYWAGNLARRYRLPGVLGEIGAGILLGPYLLGSLPLPGMPHGLFPLQIGDVPVSPELYGLATIASIILLFLSGIETDIKLFLRYAVKGSIVGLGGILAAFSSGWLLAVWWLNGSLQAGLLDPRALFLGLLCVPTSVGITARVLSEHRRLDSPEGVTILSAAVIDDVLGIILLAVIVGAAGVLQNPAAGEIDWSEISLIAVRAFAMWIGFTAVGLLGSRQISRALKAVRNPTQIAVLALGLALLLSGIFEAAGLAMIIGAYVMGLALSNTDINYVLQEQIEPLHRFFVPIFFTVMGMLVDLRVFLSPAVLGFGAAFAAVGFVGKLVGSGLPARALRFTTVGSLRVGLGMVPRGEVVLIIAGIGISSGILTPDLFGVGVMMTLFSTVAAPPLLGRSLAHPDPGTTVSDHGMDSIETNFDFGSREITEFLTSEILKAVRNEGFFIHAGEIKDHLYQIRKDNVFISMRTGERSLHFTCQREDITFVKNVVFESVVNLQHTVTRLRNFSTPAELQTNLVEDTNRNVVNWYRYLDVGAISLQLRSRNKEDILTELLDLLESVQPLPDRSAVERAIHEREQIMSTGMQHGIAIPHARTAGIGELRVAVGLAPQGIEFGSLDGEPSRIFFLVVSPESNPGPHLQILAGISAALNSAEARDALLQSSSRTDLIQTMVRCASMRTGGTT